MFGEERDATSKDLPETLSFQHKLIQEVVAAYYIVDQVNKDPSSLERHFPSMLEYIFQVCWSSESIVRSWGHVDCHVMSTKMCVDI